MKLGRVRLLGQVSERRELSYAQGGCFGTRAAIAKEAPGSAHSDGAPDVLRLAVHPGPLMRAGNEARLDGVGQRVEDLVELGRAIHQLDDRRRLGGPEVLPSPVVSIDALGRELVKPAAELGPQAAEVCGHL
jgi:hypothetical protein